MRLEKGIESGQRKITEMLMIDRVKFATVDQIFHIGHFEDRHTVLLQQDADPLDKTVQVGHVRQDIVGDNNVGLFSLIAQFSGKVGAEKLRQRGHASLFSHIGDVPRRVNPQGRYAGMDKILQEVAVIARDLNHKAIPVQVPASDQSFRKPLRMAQHGIRKRGKIQVIPEEHIGRNGSRYLNQKTNGAKNYVKGISRLCLVKLLGRKQ